MKLLNACIILMLMFAQLAFANIQTLQNTIKSGAHVYKKFCNVCHHERGVAIQGGSISTGPVKTTINTVLFGKKHSKMPAFFNNLTNKEAAEVITYIRNSWGNQDQLIYGPNAGGLISTSNVKKERENPPFKCKE